ncbi:MAG: DUF695 domain-containing protein [Bacteroidia bacterium]
MGLFKKLFNKKNKNENSRLESNEIRVFFPEEAYSTIEFNQDDLPGIGVIADSLKQFKERKVFGYHLSVVIYYNDLIENGMPSQKEREETDPFCEYLEDLLKGDNPKHPNGLFLGRLTWNKTRELIWKIHDPEIADKELKRIIETEEHPLPFDYRMDPDSNWELSKHLLGEN